jgi:hypothetical protein
LADTTAVDPEYRRYLAEIELYEKEFKAWETRGKKVLKLYKDSDNSQGKRKRFNILWSNVQTLAPACYARDPQPVAERRFKDADPIGRTASEVLERCLSYTIDCQDYGHTMRQVVSDRLLPGRGVAWVRYVPTIESEQITNDSEPSESVSYEQAVPDYVYWEDFGHNVARTWGEVWLVWRKVYMTRAKLVKRFGQEIGGKIQLDFTPKGINDEKTAEDIKKACVYEGWDRDKGQIVFLTKNHPDLIETRPDPLELTGMFPCPRPLFATLTTDSLVPVADYALYQTQAQEIEELTVRIDGLQEALKLRGAYDSSSPELGNILQGAGNKLIPVTNWAKFSEKGGIDGSIQFVPIEEVATTLISLYEAREKSKADLYEITGLADIIRGNSEPEETATAQQIKGRFAVLRIADTQTEVQRFARDVIRLLGEIIAEHFSLDTIKAISGVKLMMQAEKEAAQQQIQLAQTTAQETGQEPPPVPEKLQEQLNQPTWEEVYALLSDQVLREFRIDIETDSTIRMDEDADRMARTEFLTAAGAYIDKASVAVQTMPELAPLLGEMLMFGVRSFRAARPLEPVFEDAMKKLTQRQPSAMDPAMAQVQGELALKEKEIQLKVQAENAKQAAQAAQERERMQLEDQRAERDAERQIAVEREKAQLHMQEAIEVAKIKASADLQVAEMQGAQQRDELAMKERSSDKDRDSNERVAAADRDTSDKRERDNAKEQRSLDERNADADRKVKAKAKE